MKKRTVTLLVELIMGVFFWCLLVPMGILLFLIGFKMLFFWYRIPKTVGSEGISSLLLRELGDFERILVLKCFVSDNLAWEPRFQVGAFETFRKR